jgi:hypothetical protein
MSARQVTEFINEFGGERVEVIVAEAAGSMPAFWEINVEMIDEDKRVLVLSERDSAKLSGALLPELWWEALLRHAYRMGWAEGAGETGGVDRHGADTVHPKEDATVKRLLAMTSSRAGGTP